MAKPQYGGAHKTERKKWRRLIDQGSVSCCLCGRWLPPGSPFDLDHLPGTETYRGAACPRCNRSEGATRGNRMRGMAPSARRWAL